ncbi:MAG: hypothetical protein ACKOW8_00195 [Flavobacteriales bacterium]
MKKTVLFFLLVIGCTAYGQRVIPSMKVQMAYSQSEIAAFSEDVLAELNLRGDKLCWFEDVKVGAELSNYQLVKRSGELVNLSLAELDEFNPLLYCLPQSERVCENLMITTTDGVSKLLVVRSVEMMTKEKQRYERNKK